MSDLIDVGFGVTGKELVIEDLPVHGKIPEWLSGSFIRNGPGTFRIGEEHYRHWFDGLAMMHKFTFRQGRVAYANKFLQCQAYEEAMKTGRISYSEFATDPCRNLFQKMTAVFNQKITDSAKVNVAEIGNRFIALGETSMQIEFDPETLQSLGVYRYEEQYKQHITTVHPQFDAQTNEVFQHVTRFSRISHYRLKRIEPTGNAGVVCEIPVTYPGYIHSFGLSPNYLILVEFPIIVYPLRLLFQLKPFIENFKWKPERGARFFVINRHSGELAGEFTTEAFFAFHHVNAFERDNKIYVDIDAYDDASIISSFYLNRLKENDLILPKGQLRRYQIDLNDKANSVSFQKLSETGIEMPRFDSDRMNMNGDYLYVYGIGVSDKHPGGFYNQIVKINIQNGTSLNWYKENHYPGEPVFIPNPESQSEDDGVILSIVLDIERENSYLLVLDARSFEEIGRAVVEQPILIGYHGNYFNNLHYS